MATPSLKSAHYTQQLHSVLLRGAWGESSPGRDPRGSTLTWTELLRKYRKHTANDDLANVASATQALALLLIPSRPLGSTSPPSPLLSPEALDMDVFDQKAPLKLGAEGMLADERKEEAEAALGGLDISIEKSPARESIQLARAHFAYCLGNPSECLSILSQIQLSAGQMEALPSSSTQVFSTTSHSDSDKARQRTGSVSTSTGRSSVADSLGTLKSQVNKMRPELVWWTLERVRGRCEEGMSHESLNKVSAALQAYDAGLQLVQSLDLLGITTKDEKAVTAVFREYRELWRWVERLLRRRCIIASRRFTVDGSTPYFKTYRDYAPKWTPGFRPYGCGMILSLQLRALCLHTPFPRPTSLSINNSSTRCKSSSQTSWHRDAQDCAEYYQKVLEAHVTFPRAGERNDVVNDFVDMCMAIWERGGCLESEAVWVTEIMWWGTRSTFHSQRILRHLTRLLIASGEYSDAKRTFLLYVQLLTKGRQTSAGDVSLQQKRMQTDLPAEHPEVIADEDGAKVERGAGEDSDDDVLFLSMLLFGVRMFCRYGNEDDITEAKRMIGIAQDIVGETPQQQKWWPSAMRANLLTCRGILAARMVDFEHNATVRPKHLSDARDLLQQAAELDKASASTFWHLATVQSALREVDAAVISARRAVELGSGDVRTWHLLGLLLTSQEDWENALEILELGLVKTQEDMNPSESVNESISKEDGVVSHDFAEETNGTFDPTSRPTLSRTATVSIIGARSEAIPSSALLHYPIPIVPFQSISERFEASVQMLLTQLALSERYEGAEKANERWPEVFAFFSSHCPSGPPESSGVESFEQITSQPDTIGALSSETDPVPRIGVIVPPSPTVADSHTIQAPPEPATQHNRLSVHKRLLQGHRPLNPLNRRKSARGPSASSGLRTSSYHSSAPDLHAPEYFQASSIHSRRRSPVGSYFHGQGSAGTPERSLSPTAPSPYATSHRSSSENRLLSEIWLTSAATFRRMGRLDQAKGAIMEAEVLDEDNPNVWVQYALYLLEIKEHDQATESLSKALTIDPDHIPATIHLAQLFLTPSVAGKARLDPTGTDDSIQREAIDMAAGTLESFTRRAVGWNIPEAWYFLAKAIGLQGRRERQRECLTEALRLEEGRPIRSLAVAFPPCL